MHNDSGYATHAPQNYGSDAVTNWEELYKNFEKAKQEGIDEFGEMDGNESATAIKVDEEPVEILQFNNRYLITLSQDGVLVIDQHRAHLAVIYDRLILQIDGMNVVSQRVLFPEVIHLTPAQNAVFEEIEPEMEKAGFGVSRLSGGDWSINSIPPGLDNVDIMAD